MERLVEGRQGMGTPLCIQPKVALPAGLNRCKARRVRFEHVLPGLSCMAAAQGQLVFGDGPSQT